ncbi:unnamed protein product [Lactuca virosa]|uniref:Uncharacterized protein n=1 Tax=Lactuca virosa TaxID=75947 RepID=A0AAU9PWC9_9ASTR|nr:unnamed protein product [Lactuca virosa]
MIISRCCPLLIGHQYEHVDNYAGFSDNHTRFAGHEEEIDRKLMEAFFFRDALPHHKLADIISGGRNTF